MRIANVLRNSTYSLCSFLFIALMSIIVRKFFTSYLQIELLGLEGLFSNIVQMLSLAEMGLSSIISYGLYRELAANNKKEINILMNIYRYIYFIIGCIVFIIGVIIFFCLPWIVHDASVSWNYVQLVYTIQITSVLMTYFLAYKRTIFMSDQKDYICIKIDTICSAMKNICCLFAIVMIKSYTAYAISGLVFTIISNVVISQKVRKQYPFLSVIKIGWQDIKKRKIIADMKNLIVQKIAGFFYGGTDSILMSTFLGLHITGLMANYQIIYEGFIKIIYKVLQGIVPSIGNLIYESDMKKTWKFYNTLDLAYVMLATYMGGIYIVAFQPFIKLFFGNDFLLPYTVVILMALYVFFSVQFENACNFRTAFGKFDKDRFYIVMSAISKLLVSIPAMYFWGITGLLSANLLGWFFIGYGRVQLIFRLFFHQSMKPYFFKHFRWSVYSFLEIVFIYLLLTMINMPLTYLSLCLYCMLTIVLLTIFQVAIYWHTKEFHEILTYLDSIIIFMRNR